MENLRNYLSLVNNRLSEYTSMKKSLAVLGAFTVTLLLVLTCFLPFVDPWFFLLIIPVLMIFPHMDKIYAYLDKMME